MKVAVLGATGQLGADIVEQFLSKGHEVTALSHDEVEISSYESVRRVLTEVKPSVIVNSSAMHDVERCEREAPVAYAVNALGARNAALVARQLDATLIHISTDYVFDGTKKEPYIETDRPKPLNVYGSTKIEGESFIQTILHRHIIIRTSALYGKHPCRAKRRGNFVELMLKLASEGQELRVVNDEIVSPTFTEELAQHIVLLSGTDHFGIFHATAEGSCSWLAFAAKIMEVADVKAGLSVAEPDRLTGKATRPKYTVLENHRLKAIGLNSFRVWEEGLKSYLAASGRARMQHLGRKDIVSAG